MRDTTSYRGPYGASIIRQSGLDGLKLKRNYIGRMKEIRSTKTSSSYSMPCLGGQGDLVSRLIHWINEITIWAIGVIDLLTKSP